MASTATSVAGMPTKGPYPPEFSTLGGLPSTRVDDPITAVFLVLFVGSTATHMTILQVNKHRGHKFIILHYATRLEQTFGQPQHRNCSQVFVAAGVIILFIVNLIFTQRIIRATHPRLGWHKTFSAIFIVAYACIIAGLVANVTTVVQSFFTLSHNTRRIDRDVQLTILKMFAVAAFFPIPLVLGSIVIPKKVRVQKFGTGRFSTTIFLLLFASTVLTLGASFCAGTNYVPRPVEHPAWYHSKACFYLFDFTVEIMVVYLYALIRVDKRFHVPNKSRGPGDYSGAILTADMPQRGQFQNTQRRSIFDRVLDEEVVFDEEQVFGDGASTRLGTPVEKVSDIELAIVVPPPMHENNGNHRRWSINTMADIDSVNSRPANSRTALNPAEASATSIYSRPES